jgi:hypothetical protein
MHNNVSLDTLNSNHVFHTELMNIAGFLLKNFTLQPFNNELVHTWSPGLAALSRRSKERHVLLISTSGLSAIFPRVSIKIRNSRCCGEVWIQPIKISLSPSFPGVSGRIHKLKNKCTLLPQGGVQECPVFL